jgi:hypothetical protein
MKETDLFIVQRPSGVDSGTYKVAASDIPANAVVSATAPTDPMDGGLWFDSNSDTLKTWNGTAWVESSSAGGVTSVIAGDGISVDQATGDVTITNTGGGGGIEYNGLSAWGLSNGAGDLLNGMNVTGVTRTSTGTYRVNLATPMPSANYSAVATSSNAQTRINTLTPTDFIVKVFDSSNTVADANFQFQVAALNALPPAGGTGTDAWVSVGDDGNVNASFNIASVVDNGGNYTVTFVNPMPTADYAVTTACNTQQASPNTVQQFVLNKTTTGFLLSVRVSDNTVVDGFGWSATVNATNATLPQTVTQEQIEAAINNPGAAAWGKLDSNGNLLSGSNIASSSKLGTGRYSVTFNTPMPNANYSIQVNTTGFSSVRSAAYANVTSTGFEIYRYNASGAVIDGEVTFAVFATNALPPKGGTGIDAWASTSGDATLLHSFNIASVTKSGTSGRYVYTFTTPMPDASYAVQATSNSTSQPKAGAYAYDKSATGFSVQTFIGASGIDAAHAVSVNATNATLPSSFTEAQIQTVVDLAQNPQAIAKAWGKAQSNGTIDSGFNLASVTKTGTGFYDVVFTTPMPDDSYAVVVSGDGSQSRYPTATGFTIETRNANGTLANYGSTFTVHSN